MPYTVKQLASLTGLTPRTLRYYDAIGLLQPRRSQENGYRLYGSGEVDRLQQILLYREMGLPLEAIGGLLDAPGFDRAAVLRERLRQLQSQRQQVEAMICTVRRTLSMLEGGDSMTDREKFESMKQRVIAENEAAYGREVRERYGSEAADGSARRLSGMTEQEWEQMQAEEKGYQAALLRAMEAGDPAGEDAQEACRLHRAWLGRCWTPEMLTDEAHIQLVEMYGQDERFTAFYEKIAPGCAAFFAQAVRAFYRRK